jgi:hypothetical protein
MKTCFRTDYKHVAFFDITRFPIYKIKKELGISYIIPPNVDGFVLSGALMSHREVHS